MLRGWAEIRDGGKTRRKGKVEEKKETHEKMEKNCRGSVFCWLLVMLRPRGFV
jgi:hypothetical protein